jgi:hypothetical protein
MLGGLFVGSVILGSLGLAFFDLIETFDWCPQHRWEAALLAAGIGGGIGSSVGFIVGWMHLRRQQDLKRLADTESAEFIEKADDRLAERAKTLLGKLGSASLRNVMKPVEAGDHTSTWIGDLSVSDGEEHRRVKRQTIAAFHQAGLSLPQFILQPKRLMLKIFAAVIGLQEIHFADHPRFSDGYHLSSSAQHLATQLFDKSLLDHFSARDDYEIGGDGDWLIVAAPQRGHLSAEGRKRFANQAREILALFVAASRDVDTSAVQQDTPSPTVGLSKLLPAGGVTDSDVTEFLDEPVPRSVPKQVARPHLVPTYVLAIFAAFFLFASCFSIPVLFLASAKVAFWFAAVPLTLGSVLLWAAWRMRRNRLRLLSHGQVAAGFIQSVTKTIAQPSRTRYRVEVHYEAMGIPTTGVIKVPGDIIEEVWDAQEQDRNMQLIFDPHAPQHCLLTRQLSTSWLIHPSMRKPSDAAGD